MLPLLGPALMRKAARAGQIPALLTVKLLGPVTKWSPLLVVPPQEKSCWGGWLSIPSVTWRENFRDRVPDLLERADAGQGTQWLNTWEQEIKMKMVSVWTKLYSDRRIHHEKGALF